MRQLGVFAAAILLALSTITASAQEAITVRYYLVPKVGSGTSTHDPIRPKYIRDWDTDHPGDARILFTALDYGLEDAMLVAAQVTASQHAVLVANLDVTAIPNPIDSNVSGVALTKVQSSLESAMLPGNWVTTGHTYRDVLRSTAKSILFMERFSGQFGKLFAAGVTLDTTMNQLTGAQRNQLRTAAQSLGFDTTGISLQSTLRDALKALGDQLPPVVFGGDTF